LLLVLPLLLLLLSFKCLAFVAEKSAARCRQAPSRMLRPINSTFSHASPHQHHLLACFAPSTSPSRMLRPINSTFSHA
jgi:hypothetical protein